MPKSVDPIHGNPGQSGNRLGGFPVKNQVNPLEDPPADLLGFQVNTHDWIQEIVLEPEPPHRL